jgi:hypothetical protein
MTITFKSTPENYAKECDGRKCNTCRKRDDLVQMEYAPEHCDPRFILLDDFRYEKIDRLEIQLVNTETGESFTRQITDVTLWEGIYIISWMPPKTLGEILRTKK